MTTGSEIGTVIMAIGFLALVTLLGSAMVRPEDRRWLPTVVALGYLAKLVGTAARYWVLQVVYGGSGDARGYHGSGTRLNDIWRSLQVPEFELGTEFVDIATGLLYVPYEPTFFGGFVVFATLAFLGQILLYAAFRHVARPDLWKWYALAAFFYPTLVYWPSSIGKEALMLLFIGVAAYGVARLLAAFDLAGITMLLAGLAGGAAIRPHIPLLIIGALFPTVLVAKGAARSGISRRIIVLGTSGLLLVALVALSAQDLNFDLAAVESEEGLDSEIDALATRVSDRTDSGGSTVEGSLPQSPAELPAAFLKVLFRPLPYEATSLVLLAASVEGTLLLAIVLWRLPAIVRSLPRIRRQPYALFSLLYTFGFVFAFSTISNLGVLARQRTQVVPFLLAALVLLRWRKDEPAPAEGPLPVATARQLVAAP